MFGRKKDSGGRPLWERLKDYDWAGGSIGGGWIPKDGRGDMCEGWHNENHSKSDARNTNDIEGVGNDYSKWDWASDQYLTNYSETTFKPTLKNNSYSTSAARALSHATGNVVNTRVDNSGIGFALMFGMAFAASFALVAGALVFVAGMALVAAIGIAAVAAMVAAGLTAMTRLGDGVIELLRDKSFYDHERGMKRDEYMFRAWAAASGAALPAQPAARPRAIPQESRSIAHEARPALPPPQPRALPVIEPDLIIFDDIREARARQAELARLRSNGNGAMGARHADW